MTDFAALLVLAALTQASGNGDAVRVYEFPQICAVAVKAVLDNREWGRNSEAMKEFTAQRLANFEQLACVQHERFVEVIFTKDIPMSKGRSHRFIFQKDSRDIYPVTCKPQDCLD